MRVLVADSSLLLSERLADALKGLEGLEIVSQTQNVDEALSGIRRLKPDIVLIDVHLLGSSGLSLLKPLKQDRGAPLVIMLTNGVSSLYAKRCFDAGADYLLDKNLDGAMEILRRLVRNGDWVSNLQDFGKGE